MGQTILKAAPDHDLYCIWSSVVDQPVMIGTRAEIFEDLTEHTLELGGGCSAWHPDDAEAALKRADDTGCSSRRWPRLTWERGGPLTVDQIGTLPRDRLSAFLEVLLRDPTWWVTGELSTEATALLLPFEEG